MNRLLLISNSTSYGKGYLDHCAETLVEFLQDIRHTLFVPYALVDHDKYATMVKKRFSQMGIDVLSVHESRNPLDSIQNAESFFIGGGNTFLLLKELYDRGLIEPIQKRVKAGIPYIGSSAGSIVACKSINTTNDMPIVWPPSLSALGLVRINLNPHYVDPSPSSKHMGETRDERIAQFHEIDRTPVIGLREGAFLWINGNRLELRGTNGGKLFCFGQLPFELSDTYNLSNLSSTPST